MMGVKRMIINKVENPQFIVRKERAKRNINASQH